MAVCSSSRDDDGSPRRRHRRASPWIAMFIVGALGVVLVAPTACQTPTQVTVIVSADSGTCSALRDVAISVGPNPYSTESKVGDGFYATTTSMRCDSFGVIGTLVVTPTDDSELRGAIIVALGVGQTRADTCKPSNGYAGCIVARRFFTFREHQKLTLPVHLVIDCLNVPCDAVSSCKRAQCVTSEATCLGALCDDFGFTPDGKESIVDASTSNDASKPPDSTAPPTTTPDADLPDGTPPPGVDAGPCKQYEQNIACDVGTICPKSMACCTSYSGGNFDPVFRCRDESACTFGPPFEEPITVLRCRSSRECASDQKCCGHTAGNKETRCIPAGQPCPDNGYYFGSAFIGCTDECECFGKACGGAQMLPGVRGCMP